MNIRPPLRSLAPLPSRCEARVAFFLLLAIALGVLIGLGVAKLRSSRSAPSPESAGAGQPASPGAASTSGTTEAGPLSAGTVALLQGLKAPVQLHFYQVLDAGTTPAGIQEFAKRVEDLLAAYRRESGGRIQVTRLAAGSDAAAAAAAGMQPFNLEKGAACYLGLVLAQGARKETLPRLLPEWEPALEADLSRALSRLLSPAGPKEPAATAASAASDRADPAVLAEVKRLIPDPGAVSLVEGSRILREAALKEFREAVGQFEPRLKEAQERLVQLDASKPASERQAALQALQQLQLEQAEKLKEVTLRSSAQIDALRQLKESAR